MPFAIHSGLEWWLTPIFAIRGGVEQVPAGVSTQLMNIGAGAGIKLNGLSFDYAYLNDGSLAANSAHFFTLSFLPEAAKATSEAAGVRTEIKKESLADELKKKMLLRSVGEIPAILTPKPLEPKKAVKAKPKPKVKAKPIAKKNTKKKK